MAAAAPIRVLLVDEDERDYLVTRGHLTEIAEPSHSTDSTRSTGSGQAYVIDWARGGDEGLQRIAENRHDVILLDQQLGRMSGLDVLRQALARGSRAAFIFLTTQADRAF